MKNEKIICFNLGYPQFCYIILWGYTAIQHKHKRESENIIYKKNLSFLD